MSSPSGQGFIRQVWHKWKTLRLPWRRHVLIGSDLAGNTFWEFKDAMNANRWRRIARYSRRTYYSEVKISPQWHQWLRHTREEAPSLREQHFDVARQVQLKQLAQRADERWKSLPSYRDSPKLAKPQPPSVLKDPGGYAAQTEPSENEGVTSAVEDPEKVKTASEGQPFDEERLQGKMREKRRERGPSPWQQPDRGAPSENWQPEAWTPGAAPRR